jgi:hypothetical protein
MTEPRRPEDGPFERELREASRGESAATPALVLGGVGGVIGIVVGVVVVIALLVWWLV